MTMLSLREIVDSRPNWETLTAAQLLQSFERSVSPAADLRAFFAAVEDWWTGAPEAERGARRGWVSKVAEDFLRELGRERVKQVVAGLSSIDEKLTLLGDFALRDVGRYLISFALDETGDVLASELPRDLPSNSQEVWGRRLVLLIELVGICMGAAERFARILTACPQWAIQLLLRLLGTLVYYDNYYADLAYGFVLSSRSHVIAALAHVVAGPRSQRQSELIHVIASRAADEGRRHLPPGAATPGQAMAFLRSLVSTVSGEKREQLEAFIASRLSHRHELGRLFAAYLAAVPENHEDVVDYLTRHGTRPRGRAIGTWGSMSGTVNMYGSMRTHSVLASGRFESDPDAPSPDFDVGTSVSAIPPAKIVELVARQRDPEFSLDYIVLVSNHPQFDAIADSVVANKTIVDRWEHAESKYAGVIWAKLERPAIRALSFRQLRQRLFPVLLPNIESESLEHILFSIHEELAESVQMELRARLKRRPGMSELRHLLETARHMGGDAYSMLLNELDVSHLVDPAADSRDRWLDDLSRLRESSTDVAERILDALDVDTVASLAADPHLTRVDNATWTLGPRLDLKASLIRRWHRLGGPTEAGLRATVNPDFNLMWHAGLEREPLGHDPGAPNPLGPADRWLDAIAHCAPSLVPSYAEGMLRLGIESRSDWPNQSAIAAGRTLVRWLRRNSIEVHEHIWNALEARVAVAADAQDIETAAELAALEFEGAEARRRAFWEKAVGDIKSAMQRANVVSYSGALGRLVRVLLTKAPDLATVIDKNATR